MNDRSGGFRGLLRSGAGIAVAMGVMNVATYGFTMVAARMLGPRAYGALAGLMATLLVISVLQLGLQATAARRISADPQHVDQIQSIMLRVTYRGALALGVVLLALSPLLNVALRLDSLPTAALIAVTAVPLTIMGGQAGVLQGERRWTPLALMYIAAGVPRLLVGFALMLWSPTEASAMSGVALGAFVPIVVGFVALRHSRPAGESDAKHGAAQVIWESFRNSQALFAFFALSNVDVVVARNVLSDHDAGLYASGLILVKAVLFLPQFVVVVAFPAMSTVTERRHALTRSLILVALLGLVSTTGAWLLPDLALVFVGGAEYAEIAGRLWVFAVVGTLLSMLQLLVYAVLARQGARSVYLVWMSLLVLVGVGFTVSSVTSLLLLVLALDGTLFAVLLGISLYLVADPAPAEETAASPDQ